MNVSPIKTMYIRKTKKSGSDISVIYQLDYDARKVDYSIAKCRKGDTFIRKDGRDAALERFVTNQTKTLDLNSIGSDRYFDVELTLRGLNHYG